MSRKPLDRAAQALFAATLALGASRAVLADDNSMSRLTGDSYAFFNDLEYSAGRFNVARTRDARAPVASMPKEASPMANTPKEAPTSSERRVLLADAPLRVTLPSPFRDNTGA